MPQIQLETSKSIRMKPRQFSSTKKLLAGSI
jgi:hypothetical protein